MVGRVFGVRAVGVDEQQEPTGRRDEVRPPPPKRPASCALSAALSRPIEHSVLVADTSEFATRWPYRSVGVVTTVLPAVLGIPFARIAPAMYAAFASLCLLMAVVAWRIELRCGPDGVELCNGFRRRRVLWPEVETIGWGYKWPFGPAVVLHLLGGRQVVLVATQGFMSRDTESSPEAQMWLDRVRRSRPPAAPHG